MGFTLLQAGRQIKGNQSVGEYLPDSISPQMVAIPTPGFYHQNLPDNRFVFYRNDRPTTLDIVAETAPDYSTGTSATKSAKIRTRGNTNYDLIVPVDRFETPDSFKSRVVDAFGFAFGQEFGSWKSSTGQDRTLAEILYNCFPHRYKGLRSSSENGEFLDGFFIVRDNEKINYASKNSLGPQISFVNPDEANCFYHAAVMHLTNDYAGKGAIAINMPSRNELARAQMRDKRDWVNAILYYDDKGSDHFFTIQTSNRDDRKTINWHMRYGGSLIDHRDEAIKTFLEFVVNSPQIDYSPNALKFRRVEDRPPAIKEFRIAA